MRQSTFQFFRRSSLSLSRKLVSRHTAAMSVNEVEEKQAIYFFLIYLFLSFFFSLFILLFFIHLFILLFFKIIIFIKSSPHKSRKWYKTWTTVELKEGKIEINEK